MQYTYHITEQDFVDFNLHFVKNDKVIQRMLKRVRLMTAGLVIVGGSVLMLAFDEFSLPSLAIYLVLAVAVYFYVPFRYHSQVRRNVRKTLRGANNKHICGEKTLTIKENEVNLKGVSEDSTYEFSAFSRVAAGENQVYLHLDDVSALIVPNTAFADLAARDAFIADIEKKLAASRSAAEKNAEETE